MKYKDSGEYEVIAEKVELVPYSKEYPIENFDCGIEDYNNFLVNDAPYYIDNNISSVHLLVDVETREVIGYMALLTDAFLLDKEEKRTLELDIPFSSVPALKIGKLATSKNRKELPYGSFLLYIALGIAAKLESEGIACRFLTVDADVEFFKDTPMFYEANGFEANQHKTLISRKNNVSMRYDLFNE